MIQERSDWVSVIMPNYNKGEFAAIAATSVLAQTHANVELIFIDDHSNDGSEIPIGEMAVKDERVKLLSTPASRSGGGLARNIGIKEARGEYIIFLDSDDYMDPQCVEGRIAAMKACETCDFIAFPMGVFYKIPGDSMLITNIPKSTPDLVRFVLRDQPWLISGAIWKSDFIRKLGGFSTSLISQQDADLHTRALIATKSYKYIHNAPTVHYRQEVESIARNNSQSYEALLQRAEMLREHIALAAASQSLSHEMRVAFAQYLLDIAQMMRWHKATAGKEATIIALKVWYVAYDNELIDSRMYRLGREYIKFKHSMLWNTMPVLQHRRELRYRRQLGNLIFTPSLTLCKSAFKPND